MTPSLVAWSKKEVWEKGIWHRISRIFLINSKGEILIQKRSIKKASLPGRWDQSAAGHVEEGETYEIAADRELKEETGVSGVVLKKIGSFKSQEIDEADKIKNRFNTMYVGTYDGDVNLDPDEVSETRWIAPAELEVWMEKSPNDFTEGFLLSFRKFVSEWLTN